MWSKIHLEVCMIVALTTYYSRPTSDRKKEMGTHLQMSRLVCIKAQISVSFANESVSFANEVPYDKICVHLHRLHPRRKASVNRD